MVRRCVKRLLHNTASGQGRFTLLGLIHSDQKPAIAILSIVCKERAAAHEYYH